MNVELAYYGHPTLRTKCEEVEEITPEIRELARAMLGRLIPWSGVGLAAPQVFRPIRMFVIRHDEYLPDGTAKEGEPRVYINPKLSDPSEETWVYEEGCLSMPGFRVPVVRPVSITVEATDLDGNSFTERLHEWEARTRMHENDHLNGVLIIDRTDPKSRKKVKPHLDRLKNRYK